MALREERRKRGIPVDATTWLQIREAAISAGMSPAIVDTFASRAS
jgi:hypothetical protein